MRTTLQRTFRWLRPAPAPVFVKIGAAAWTAEWTPRRARGAATAMRIEMDGPTDENETLSQPEAFGAQLRERLCAAGVRETSAVLTIPLDWTASFRAARPPGLAAEDVADYLELQAERAAPFGGAGWKLASPPDGGGADAPILVGALLPESRWSAIERIATAARLRWVSVRTNIPAVIPNDPGATLDVLPFGARLIVAARRDGRLLDWFTAPGNISETDLSARMAIFLASMAADDAGGVWPIRWGDEPDERLRALVEGWRRSTNRPIAASNTPTGGTPFEFVRVSAPPAFRGAELLRRTPRGARRGGAAALVVVLAMVAYRALTENILRARVRRLAPVAREAAVLQQRLRQYRPWLEPPPVGAPLLEALAACFPEEGRVWARRLEVKDQGQIAFIGAARASADAMALLDRLRQHPGVREAQTQYLRGDNPVQFAVAFEWRPAP